MGPLYIILQQIFAIFALWLAGKSRLAYQLDNLITRVHMMNTQSRMKPTEIQCVSQSIQDKLKQKIFNIRVSLITKEFNDLCILVAKFNLFSKEITFLMTSAISLTNACLFYLYYSLIDENPLLGYFCLFLVIEFMAGSLYILNVGASLDKKSKKLYKIFNSLYVCRAKSIDSKKKILFLIKSVGSKVKPLSLINHDNQVFDKVLLGRYLVFSLRMIFYCIKFVEKVVTH